MDGTLYDGDKLLAKGSYSLSSGSKIVTGSMAVGDAVALLNFHFLTLRPKIGKDMEIVPRRIEHSAGEPPTLIFDVVP
jgi:hypothetical protein